jgi:dTMP kinase
VRGVFITFEGPEGGGKSSQARRLVARLESQGLRVLLTREPGGTPVGEAIRNLLQHDAVGEKLVPEAELLLFAASRAQLVREVILPALEAGTIVISDRFADSTTAYQGYARQRDIEPLLAINAFAIADAVPDLTVLLDIDIDAGFERVVQRYGSDAAAKDRFEREAREFHQRVRRGYLELAGRWPQRFKVVDASRDIAEVEGDVAAHVARLLASR